MTGTDLFWTPEIIKLVGGAVTVILLGLAGAIAHYDRRRRQEGNQSIPDQEVKVDLSPLLSAVADHEKAAQERHKTISKKIDDRDDRLHQRLDGWRIKIE